MKQEWIFHIQVAMSECKKKKKKIGFSVTTLHVCDNMQKKMRSLHPFRKLLLVMNADEKSGRGARHEKHQSGEQIQQTTPYPRKTPKWGRNSASSGGQVVITGSSSGGGREALAPYLLSSKPLSTGHWREETGFWEAARTKIFSRR